MPLIVGLRKTVHYFEKELQKAKSDQSDVYGPEDRTVPVLVDLK